jgi:hypothetical protein
MTVTFKTILRTFATCAALTAAGTAFAQQCSQAECNRRAAEIRAYAATAGSPQSVAVLQDMHRRYYACGCR